MSPLLFVGPLLVAHFVTPAREVRGHGIVVHATASELDVTSRGKTQRIQLVAPVQSIAIVDAHTVTTRAPNARTTYVDGREVSSCRFVAPVMARVGTLVRTSAGRTTFTKLTLGFGDGNPCD